MRKFIIEVLIGSAFIALVSYLCYTLPVQSSNFVEIMNDDNRDFDIINLGSSHGLSFVYSEIGVDGRQYATPSNTLYYDLQNFMHLQSTAPFKKETIVLLPLSYYHFHATENRDDLGINNPFVNDYYHILEDESIYHYSSQKRNSLKLLKIQTNVKALFQSKTTEHETDNTDPKEHIRLINAHGPKRAKSHMIKTDQEAVKRNLAYLKSLISEIRSADLIPVIVLTPYYYSYVEAFPPEWLEHHFYQHLRTIGQDLNIPIYSYERDARFYKKAELFRNSDHLNDQGKKEFTQMLISDLTDSGIFRLK